MMKGLIALTIISGISALMSGTGWRGFFLAMAALLLTAAILLSQFQLYDLVP